MSERQSTATTSPADAAPTTEHYLTAGSTGGLGECSASCACGVTFDGFDTHREAANLVEQHVADATKPAATERPNYRVALPKGFVHADRELTLAGTFTADELPAVIASVLSDAGYDDLDVTVDLVAGIVRITWQGAVLDGTITGPGVGEQSATGQPTTRIGRAVSLKTAIDGMARRYGASKLRQGVAVDYAERDQAERAAHRQYTALLRLTAALSDLAMDGTR